MKHLVLSITLFLFIGLTWSSTSYAAPPDKPDYEKAIDALKEKYRDNRAGISECSITQLGSVSICMMLHRQNNPMVLPYLHELR